MFLGMRTEKCTKLEVFVLFWKFSQVHIFPNFYHKDLEIDKKNKTITKAGRVETPNTGRNVALCQFGTYFSLER